MYKSRQPQFSCLGYCGVGTAVVDQNNFVHHIKRHVAIGLFQRFRSVVGRHYSYNLFTVQQISLPLGSNCKFYHRSPGLNTVIAKEQDSSSLSPKHWLFGSRKSRVFATAGKQRLLASLLLIPVTFLLYAHLKEHRFINYDDPGYVTSNIRVQQGLSWKNVVWAFKATSLANWHPLTWI